MPGPARPAIAPVSAAAEPLGRQRRQLLAAMGGATLAGVGGCAGWPGVEEERIVEVASGRRLTRTELLAALAGCEVVLLGELHDNPRHHARRGALLADLAAVAPGTALVAEHLDRGRAVAFGADLRASLVAAGFDVQGWQWPLHEPLFAAIARARLPLRGGNAPRERVREVARSGLAAAPAELRALIEAAPLTAAAQAELDADLIDGHCGRLPAARLPGMRAAQRVRDAAMALALRESGGRPAVLLAGNGHVRTDFGVPQILTVEHPALRLASVGFLEPGAELAGAPYTHVWVTPAVPRTDPCAGLPPIAPAAPERTAPR